MKFVVYLLNKVGRVVEDLDSDTHASPSTGVDDAKAAAGDAPLEVMNVIKVN